MTQGLARRPRSTALPGQQAGADHDLGVGRVGAARDRGDHHVAVGQLVVRRRGRLGRGAARRSAQGDPVGVGRRGERDPVLGPGRAGQGRLHVPQVERHLLGVHRLGSIGVVPQALRLGVGLHQREVLLVTAREAHVVQRHLVDREHGAGGAVLGAHVADRRPRLERQRGHARSVALDERADDAVVAQELGHRQHHVGRGDARLRFPGDPQPHDGRQQHGERLAQHGGLGFDTADTPAQHPEAVDHRRV